LKHSHVVFIVSALLSCISGCGISGWRTSAVSVSTEAPAPAEVSVVREQERRFAGALEYLRTGREQEARELLNMVIEGPQRSGVTDEALFRLSLLSLRDDAGKGASRSQLLLERLRTEFPLSIWTHQAAPLSLYLADARNLRDRQREIKTLRDLNLSLSRDNRGMRQSLERLKSLDLELEQKIKR